MTNTYRRSISSLVIGLGIALSAIAPAAAIPVVVNGGFEDPVEAPNSLTEITLSGIPGWTGDSIERWLGSSEQPRAIAEWSGCWFHAAARSDWLK